MALLILIRPRVRSKGSGPIAAVLEDALMGEALDRSRARRIALVEERDDGGDIVRLEVPPATLRLLSQILAFMARQQTFVLYPESSELTTKQAAEVLDVLHQDTAMTSHLAEWDLSGLQDTDQKRARDRTFWPTRRPCRSSAVLPWTSSSRLVRTWAGTIFNGAL